MRTHYDTLFVMGAMVLGMWATFASPTQTPRPASSSPPKKATVSFTREILPLLEKRCLGCHGVGNRLAGLDLRSRKAVLKGGGRGAALVPGNAEKSLLYHLLTNRRAPLMPPEGKLPDSEIQKFKQWIEQGAVWEGGDVLKAQKQVWWSFRPITRPPVSTITQNALWVKNPIDAFVLAKLKEKGLTPSPPSSPRDLLRRLTLDLTGLPPTPEEMQAFLADKSLHAYEKQVDRLLASPRYGERWGRHWLDLVRYADSGGFEGDKDRLLAWRYRDYVINAFNTDKPYDAFIREQIAGDELKARSNETTVATGYLACGPQDIVEVNDRTRANDLDDLISTTGSVFLGLTVACARCHDHKYDPVTMRDYYRLFAVFAPTERREIEIPTPEEQRASDLRNREVEAEIAPLRKRAEPLRQKGTQLAKMAGQANPNEEQILAALPEAERKPFKEMQDAMKGVEAKRLSLPKAMAVTDQSYKAPVCHILLRGDAYHKGDPVSAGFPAALPGGEGDLPDAPPTAHTTGRRKALADWLVRPDNPLTARVWVNRVWRQHFGRGIVNTPSNLGLNGELPSHPELLDWLASAFRANGWRLKPLHRLMLLSNTYQQANAIRPEAQAKDAQNRLLWRMPLRRLEAEAIRDSQLAVAGTLNLEMGGPPVYPPIDPSLRADTFQGPNWQDGKDDASTWRRSVYVKVKRSLLLPHLEVFDCPEISGTAPQRNITTTPLQALLLLNDPLILTQVERFTERLRRERPNNTRQQIERAYALALGRPPSPKELQMSLAFVNQRGMTGLRDFCQAIFNLNEFLYAP